MHHNWLKTGCRDCHCTPSGVVNNQGNNLVGSDSQFEDFTNQIFKLQDSSPLINNGDVISAVLLPDYNLSFEYLKYQDSETRLLVVNLDIGAFENTSVLSVDDIILSGNVEIVPNPATNIFKIDLNG